MKWNTTLKNGHWNKRHWQEREEGQLNKTSYKYSHKKTPNNLHKCHSAKQLWRQRTQKWICKDRSETEDK